MKFEIVLNIGFKILKTVHKLNVLVKKNWKYASFINNNKINTFKHLRGLGTSLPFILSPSTSNKPRFRFGVILCADSC